MTSFELFEIFGLSIFEWPFYTGFTVVLLSLKTFTENAS